MNKHVKKRNKPKLQQVANLLSHSARKIKMQNRFNIPNFELWVKDKCDKL